MLHNVTNNLTFRSDNRSQRNPIRAWDWDYIAFWSLIAIVYATIGYGLYKLAAWLLS